MDNGESFPTKDNQHFCDPVKLELLEARMHQPLSGKEATNNIHHHQSSNSQHSPNQGTTTPTPSEEPMSDDVSAGGVSIDHTDQDIVIVKDAKESKTPKHKARKRKMPEDSSSATKKEKEKDGKKIDEYFNRNQNHVKAEPMPRTSSMGLFNNPSSPMETFTCCQSIQTELTGMRD